MVNTLNSVPRIQLTPQQQKSSASITEGRATEAPAPAQQSWLYHSTFPCKWHSCPWQEPCLAPSSLVTVWPDRWCHAQITEKAFSEYLWIKAFPEGKRGSQQLPHVSPVLQSSNSTRSPCSNSVPYSAPTESNIQSNTTELNKNI